MDVEVSQGRDRPDRGMVDDVVRATPIPRHPRAPELAAALAASPLLSLLLVASAWFVLAWPWLGERHLIPWDAKLEFYPTIRFLSDMWHSGQSAAWNPFVYGGYPLLADPQSMIFQPLVALFAWLVERPDMHLVDALELGHLLMAGVAVALYAHLARWRIEGGVLAALLVMFGATAAGRLQHFGLVAGYAWFAVALLLLRLALERASHGWAIGSGLAAAAMAVGRDQVAMLGCYALAGYVLHAWISADRPAAWLRRRWCVLLTAAGVASALLLLPVLLTLQFAQLSNRPSIALAEALTGSLSPVNFLTMLAPDFFGSLGSHEGYWGPTNPRWPCCDWTDRSTNYLYLGAIPLVLLVWHGILGGRLRDPEIRYFLFLGIAATLYAVGGHGPVFALLYEWLPGVDLFRRPADAAFFLTFALALIAGRLLDRALEAGPPRPVGRAGRVLAGLALGAVLAGALLLAARFGELGRSMLELAKGALAAGVAALLVVAVSRRSPRQAVWVGAALALAVLDLRVHNVGNALNAASEADRRELARVEQGGVGSTLASLLADATGPAGRPRVEMLGLGGYWQKASMLIGVENTHGYGPLRIGDYEALTGVGQNSHENRREFTGLDPGYMAPLARLLGARFLVTTATPEALDPSLPQGAMPLVAEVGAVRVFENPAALPRAMFIRRGVVLDEQDIRTRGRWPALDPTSAVILDRRPEEWSRWATRIDGSIAEPEVEVERYGTTEVVIAVATPLRGHLVLNDLWYPGWEVEVDGRPAMLLKANLLFRAVALPPGRHRVRFRFAPLGPANLARMLARLAP